MNKIKKLSFSAIMIALATVLSVIKVWQMPLGGSITLFSMVPLCMIALVYGTGYAILPCVVYGVIQIVIDGVFAWGLTWQILLGSIVFDYILAFGSLCLAGLFRKNDKMRLLGIVIAVFARFVCHFISGAIFFANLEIFNNPFIYSLCYNGTFMLPELILTVIAIFTILKTKVLTKMFKE